MTAERLAQANALLSGSGSSLLAAPTRYLGHHVVGTLAARLGAHVEPLPIPDSGVTAYIALPGTLVQQPEPSTSPSTAAAG
ncbi:hypothetical protein [Streptomyces sp. 2A115]|uniref:hypothetical protein n=1 Tax=Streptomyces sp. 2A115 TaxID=3457439 RepID=UPI003FD5B177